MLFYALVYCLYCIKIAFGNNASAVKEMYPVSRFAEEVAVIKGDIRNSISATKQQLCLLSTDWLFTCSIRAAARAMAEQTRNGMDDVAMDRWLNDQMDESNVHEWRDRRGGSFA